MKVFFALAVLVFSLHACAPNNVTVEQSVEKHFIEAGVEGCFALLDNGNGEFTVYNLARYRDSAFIPGASFDMVTALIGLQTGIIPSDSAVLKWDGTARPASSWNKDLPMYEAFRASAVPHFQEVARRIGRDTLQHWLDTLSYGTKQIKTRVDSFWLDGSLTLTPDEQLGLVKRLYFGQLPFFKVNQEMIKRAMIQEQNTAYTLAYKTSPGTWDTARKKKTGWVTGWFEQDRQPRFFVLNLESENPDVNLTAAGTGILNRILQQLDLLPAKQ